MEVKLKYAEDYYSRPTEIFAKLGSMREAYGAEAVQYILGKKKAEIYEELWKKSKVEMATYLNTMRPAAPKLPGGKTASENILGRARGGMVYAKDGWFGFGKKGKKAADKDLFAEPTGLSAIWAKIIGAKKMKKAGAGVPKFDPPTVAPRPVTRAGRAPDMTAWAAGEDIELPAGESITDLFDRHALEIKRGEEMTQARQVLEEQISGIVISKKLHSRGMAY